MAGGVCPKARHAQDPAACLTCDAGIDLRAGFDLLMGNFLKFALLLGLSLLAACASRQIKPLDEQTRETIVTEALSQIGRPYLYGGATPAGFDCSGLVQYSYAQAGIALPRTTTEQIGAGEKIPMRDAEPADLLFYRIDDGLHVAIYLGDGRAVHAPSSGKQVIATSMDIPYWQRAFITAVRIGQPAHTE
ncbi:MAG: C40 family peptidase [Stenotrophobium sp.]